MQRMLAALGEKRPLRRQVDTAKERWIQGAPPCSDQCQNNSSVDVAVNLVDARA